MNRSMQKVSWTLNGSILSVTKSPCFLFLSNQAHGFSMWRCTSSATRWGLVTRRSRMPSCSRGTISRTAARTRSRRTIGSASNRSMDRARRSTAKIRNDIRRARRPRPPPRHRRHRQGQRHGPTIPSRTRRATRGKDCIRTVVLTLREGLPPPPPSEVTIEKMRKPDIERNILQRRKRPPYGIGPIIDLIIEQPRRQQ